MAKWFVVTTDGESLTKNDRDGSAKTLEFNSGREACSFAASFLIPFSEHVLPELTPDEALQMREVGKALEEKFGGDDDVTELEVVCVEKGIRIRMTREPLGVIANSREQ
jgi:hypothetical protein